VTEGRPAVYVYGVTTETAAPSVDGVASAPVRALSHGGLVALVSSISRTELRAADLRAHWRVLEHAFEDSTVLPVRFGTVMEDDGEVRDRLLDANRERLTELLRTMDGLVQVNVKGRYDEEALLRSILRDAPALSTLRDRANRSGALADQVALGQRVEREIDARRAGDTATVLDALEGRAVATREEQVSHPDAFNLAFLIPRGEIDAFGEGLPAVQDAIGDRIEIRYVGPAPPFSFADSALGAGERAWA
jgi:Gas vesicle synthesis protein GvpL/GvpF